MAGAGGAAWRKGWRAPARHRLLCLLFALLAALLLAPAARAVPLRINDPLCQAMTARTVPDTAMPYIPLACGGMPTDYGDRSLWLGADIPPGMGLGASPVLLMHSTRFDRVTVFFVYADGRVSRASVRAGDFQSRWRIGGQISFMAPLRTVAVTRVVIRLDGLRALGLLRFRLLSAARAGQETGVAALIAGGALALLLLGMPYNIALAFAARRAYLAWHAVWSACVLFWGMIWSQVSLLFWPGLAGTVNSQLATLVSTTAVAAAATCYLTGPGRLLARPLRVATWACMLFVLCCGIAGGPGWAVPIKVLMPLLNGSLLTLLALVSIGLIWGCVRGDREAKDSALAWTAPIIVLASTIFVDYKELLFGGGPQVAMLIASALQTVWLSLAATKRLADLRVDRDAARAAELELGELARRDPLTGLLNRRGFVERARTLFGGEGDGSFALLLIDVDHFKTINDRFGHEVGDTVLCRLANRLTTWEGARCVAGRLGGEEFMIGIGGLDGAALGEFADQVRRDLGGCDHGDVTRYRPVTVSIGAAAGAAATSFQKLYGLADRALYDAKHAGRDRIVVHGEALAPGALPAQLRFRWDS